MRVTNKSLKAGTPDMSKFNDVTNFLFADPSFTGGMATVLDMGGTLVEFNQSPNPEFADYRAIASDWAAVGESLNYSITSDEQAQQ